MPDIAVGCSHTFGTGVEPNEAWPALLGLKNYGVEGCSTDYIARVFPYVAAKEQPEVVYALWPDWTRFEYIEDSNYKQSLVTDTNRIEFMESWPEYRLRENFNSCVEKITRICKERSITLISMTLDDLIPYIDHADCWPLSKLGHHYSPLWHQWVADIFRQKYNEQT